MNLKILIVENEQDVKQMIEEGLRIVCTAEGATCDFMTINDSSLVSEIHKDQGFDLIIVDLCLNGMDVIKEVRNYDTVVALIVISADPTIDMAIEAIQQNVCAFMRKPFTLSQLATQAQNAVSRSLLRKKVHSLTTLSQDILKRHHG
jgi:DNA-binding NtrC family response regulator